MNISDVSGGEGTGTGKEEKADVLSDKGVAAQLVTLLLSIWGDKSG